MPAKYFEGLNPKNMTLQVSLENLVFDLDLKVSAQRNAAKYYEMAKKAEKRAKGAEKALEQTQMKIEELNLKMLRQAGEKSQLPPKMRRREWYEKFRWFRSSEGFLIIGGRDRTQNEILIKRYMEPGDLVFHADITGAPFVLLKAGDKQPLEKTLYETAQFAASYSRAWREGLGSVDVYWVHPNQVSKSPPMGEYLSKGAFMIYGSRNYIRNVPLEVAIGLVKRNDEDLQIIGGPPQAIANQTRIFVRIIPGNESSGRLAKRIRDLLAKMLPAEERDKLRRISLDEIQRFIPSGRGTIRK